MYLSRTALLITALALGGCGGGGSGGVGTLSVGITDAPVDNATDVVVEISGVEVHGAGKTIAFDFAPREIHLLALTGGAADTLLDQVTLPAGHYEWLRLKVNAGNSYVEASSGGTYPVRIPSGAESGLKLIRGFDVPVGGSADFTIDFDLRKSLVDTNGIVYTLKPVLRLVDNVQVGAVTGAVDLGHYGCATSGNAVYVYSGPDAAPTDINTLQAGGPMTVAPVMGPDGSGAFHYRAAFLPAGDYTVALTCAATQDTPEASETLAFPETFNVTVIAGQTTTQAFPSP